MENDKDLPVMQNDLSSKLTGLNKEGISKKQKLMLIAGIIYLFILAKYKKLNFFNLTDSASCAVPLAQSIGRWGNFFNSEAFGIPTNGQWGLFIPPENRPVSCSNYELFHPAFLYESIADILIFVVLIFLVKKNNLKTGTITLAYLILYSLARIFIEALRLDSTINVGFLHLAQIISIIIVVICIAALIIRSRN